MLLLTKDIVIFLPLLMIACMLLGFISYNPNMMLKPFCLLFSMFQTQFEVSIKSFRSNNAHDLSFIKNFKSKGVTIFHSCVETP